jgi:hypothetical protein
MRKKLNKLEMLKGVCEIFGCYKAYLLPKNMQEAKSYSNVQGRILFRESEVLELRKEDHPDILIVK